MQKNKGISSTLFTKSLATNPDPSKGPVLVTGAGGYIGGRLVPELLSRKYHVRIMVRGDTRGFKEVWPDAEIIQADAMNPDELLKALKGVHTAYYLIHSLLLGPSKFEHADIIAARNFCRAAETTGLKRIIYLGGLGDVDKELSPHLKSRIQVAEELKAGTVPVTILRAGIIIGSGSASFEIIYHLVKRLRFIPGPRWLKNRCQPTSIRDVIKYLVGVLETPGTAGQSFDIGGRDVLTYRMMLLECSCLLNRRIFFFPFPALPPKFFAWFASLVTPVPSMLTKSLFEGVKNDTVNLNQTIKRFLDFKPVNFRESLIRAFTREEQDNVHTRWSDSYPPAHELTVKLHELKAPPRYTGNYSLVSSKSADSIFNSVCRIGGGMGWFLSNWMWRLRGLIDRLLGGVGTVRGRRSSSTLRLNDVIDFWRVEDLKINQRLLLRAEMKLPGLAWLEFRISEEHGLRRLSVMPHYQPANIWGIFYWYLFLPFHHFIFRDIIKGIIKRSSWDLKSLT